MAMEQTKLNRITRVETPCYVVDQALVRKNMEIMHYVQQETGCKILLAQKGFSMFALYPMIGPIPLRGNIQLALRGAPWIRGNGQRGAHLCACLPGK